MERVKRRVTRLLLWYKSLTSFAYFLVSLVCVGFLLAGMVRLASLSFLLLLVILIPNYVAHFEQQRVSLSARIGRLESVKCDATQSGIATEVESTPQVGRLESLISQLDRELNAALLHSTDWNRSRIPFLRSSFIRLFRSQLVPNPTVEGPILEIGCDGQLASSKVLTKVLARPVVATNFEIDDLYPRIGEYEISLSIAQPSVLDFPDETFSLIFGRGVLEHIENLGTMLSECFRVLRPGGVLFLEGGPFWSTPRGHHMSIETPSGTKYGFDTMPDLIPAWFHLTTDESGLGNFLYEEQGIPRTDAQIISNYIFNTSEQNRMRPSEIMQCFTSTGFSQVRFECVSTELSPSEELLDKFSMFDLTCHALTSISVK